MIRSTCSIRTVLMLAAAILVPVAGAPAAILHVPADYATIQEAIDAAVDGDEVLIAPGTYAGSILSLVDKAITVRGSGGAEVTFLENPNGIHGVLALSDVESDTIIDGVSFANTTVRLSAGVLVIFSGSPTIQNCAFVNNSGIKPCLAADGGAGTSIVNCAFTDNLVTPIDVGILAVISIDGCTFTGNTSDGGVFAAGAVVIRGGVSVTNCTFDSNSTTSSATGGGAIYAIPAFDVTIDTCTFNNNMATMNGGGAIFAGFEFSDGGVTISNCGFTGNTASTNGGAVEGVGALVSIEQCTFDGNSATTGGGAALSAGATATDCMFMNNQSSGNGAGLSADDGRATHCVFTGNQAAGNGGAMHVLGTTSTLTNCDATGNTASGTGGGLHVGAGATATMNDSVLCMNTPDQIANNGLLFASNVLACDQPLDDLGACCLPSGGCVLTTETSCLAASGTYQGDETGCAGAGCAEACIGDLDGSGAVDFGDILRILTDWGPCPK